MTYLDFPNLSAIKPSQFQEQTPYPLIDPAGLLTKEGHEQLLASLPDISLLQRCFRVKRAHGQESHDRCTLEYEDDFLWHLPGRASSPNRKRKNINVGSSDDSTSILWN